MQTRSLYPKCDTEHSIFFRTQYCQTIVWKQEDFWTISLSSGGGNLTHTCWVGDLQNEIAQRNVLKIVFLPNCLIWKYVSREVIALSTTESRAAQPKMMTSRTLTVNGSLNKSTENSPHTSSTHVCYHLGGACADCCIEWFARLARQLREARWGLRLC